MATYLPVDGLAEVVRPKDGKAFTLAELQGYVDGYIEIVPTTYPEQKMVVNEEGLLKRLRFNIPASIIAGQSIVGSALILSLQELGEDQEEEEEEEQEDKEADKEADGEGDDD